MAISLNGFLAAFKNESPEVKKKVSEMVKNFRDFRDPYQWNKGLFELKDMGISAQRLNAYYRK